MSEDINEIKQTLEKITPGQWTYLAEVNRFNETAPIGFGFVYVRESDQSKTVVSGDIRKLADLKLIANAPEWLALLITTIESQQQKIDVRDKLITAQVGHIDTVNLHLESKDQQIARWKEEYEALKGVGELHLQQIESQKEEIERLKSAIEQATRELPYGNSAYKILLKSLYPESFKAQGGDK